MSKIKVCDAIMGSGKTTAAINLMNSEPNKKFIYITPFLEEIQRIKSCCPEKRFVEPVMSNKRNKSEDFVHLLENGHNVASTHALFKRCSADIVSLIKQGGYTLILDEVCDVVEPMEVPTSDFNMFLKTGIISVDENGRVRWNIDDYGKDGWHYSLMRSIVDGEVIAEFDQMLMWKFPRSIFEAFEEVFILTYMFDAQYQMSITD